MVGKKLSKDGLQTAEAVLGIGIVVIKELQEREIVTLFVNSDGEVELCLPGEYLLDAIHQEEALIALLDNGYTDEQLMAYIKGRNSRTRLNNGSHL